MEFPRNDFWDWTLPTYGQDAVSPACLRLQERHGVDVNVVLFAVWSASLGVELSAAEVDGVAGRVQDWQTRVVSGLRAIRTALKGDPHGAPPELAESFRDGLKRLELDAERMEHIILGPEVPDGRVDGADLTARRRMAERSIGRYLDVLGRDPDEDDVVAIETIVAAGIDGRTATPS